jgi:predicted metal-dependent phosphoesterase TrpH
LVLSQFSEIKQLSEFRQWGRADLHMHTTVSDGVASVYDLLADVMARIENRTLALEVLAITDHDRLDASLWAYAHRERYPFDIIPGVEVSCTEGHVLALWVTEPIRSGMSLIETVAAVHEQNGLAILAHPFHIQMKLILKGARRYARNPAYLVESGLDGLEVHNAGVLLPLCNRVAGRYATHLNLARTGGSDAHTLNAIGTGLTYFPGRTAEDLRQALIARQTVGSGQVWPLAAYRTYTGDLIFNHGRRWGRGLPFDGFRPFETYGQDDWEQIEAL